jgi:hypothetical protein
MSRPSRISLFFFLLVVCASLLATANTPQDKRNAAVEEFFIVAAVDISKSQLLLKLPTEVTLTMKLDEHTKLSDERNKPLKISDLRSGDTVWVVSVPSSDGQRAAVRVRRGPMTVQELHRIYPN